MYICNYLFVNLQAFIYTPYTLPIIQYAGQLCLYAVLLEAQMCMRIGMWIVMAFSNCIISNSKIGNLGGIGSV